MSHIVNDTLIDNLGNWLAEYQATLQDIRADKNGYYILEWVDGEMTDEGLDGWEEKVYLPDQFQELNLDVR